MDKQTKKEFMFLIIKLIIVALIISFLFLFVFGICGNKDDSMSPSFRNGDLVIYYRMQKEFLPTNVVVIEKEDEVQVRRIIAKEGDVVDITENGLMINGYMTQEPEIYTDTLPYREGITFPITIGKDEFFVLGDQRSNAKDSRIYGTIKQEEIKGIVMTIIRHRGF